MFIPVSRKKWQALQEDIALLHSYNLRKGHYQRRTVRVYDEERKITKGIMIGDFHLPLETQSTGKIIRMRATVIGNNRALSIVALQDGTLATKPKGSRHYSRIGRGYTTRKEFQQVSHEVTQWLKLLEDPMIRELL